MKPHTYLDFNASTPLRPKVKETIIASLESYGNPSSIHSFGRKSKAMIENARDVIANKIGVKPSQVVFTSGGTESNNFCLNAAIKSGKEILVSAIEHESIKRFYPAATLIEVDSDGVIRLDHLKELFSARKQGSVFVSVMLANNETGVIQPIQEIATLVRAHGSRMHCDAVTAFTKTPLDYISLGVDYISLSAHKIGGPKGIGALIVRTDEQLPAYLLGGGQEKGHRAGTENLLGIAGFAKAVEESKHDSWSAIADLRDRLEANILSYCPHAPIYGKSALRLPNTSLIGMPGVEAIKQIMAFDLEGYAVSAGSACSSGKIEPSKTLLASGFNPREAQEAIRISLGWNTTPDETDHFFLMWQHIYNRLKS